MSRIPSDAPRLRADHIYPANGGPRFKVICPYCGDRHEHHMPPRGARRAWRAPGCGMYRNADDRARGYVIEF